MIDISVQQARRLALISSGLLSPSILSLPSGRSKNQTQLASQALEIIRHFGYLQLDTVKVSGARSHSQVLMSRLPFLQPETVESLLPNNEQLFEYWGHEASWIPIEFYPYFEFRRKAFKSHPWWGDIVADNPELSKRVLSRIRKSGPLRSKDFSQSGQAGSWWGYSLAKKVATAYWCSGQVAISSRQNFQRSFDIAKKVIPAAYFGKKESMECSYDFLNLKAIGGLGWAEERTIAACFRLKPSAPYFKSSIRRLAAQSKLIECRVKFASGLRSGWASPELLEASSRARAAVNRPRLLSPFDPLIWDRERTRDMFEFDQVLEIYKPKHKRKYGYYCLPVLLGDRLVARVDLKVNQKSKSTSIENFHAERLLSAREAKRVTALATQSHCKALQLKQPKECSTWNI